ncbi:hypothetical protein [Vibrio parahaemolyticus]|uniref:hypothetical protein n=1 Tax=Vibrio parahaemolyticus TaxID=670 RepID=UPI002363027E|nr:hypothetical protein [Vibrio parahaemolyticus]
MNSTIQLSRFRKLVNDVLAAMLQGKRFTKSELNSLIPKGMNKSADDIIRLLRQTTPLKICYQREKTGQPAYWYVAEHGCKECKYFPNRHCAIKVRKDIDSVKDDVLNIIDVYQRQGEEFIKDVVAGLSQ